MKANDRKALHALSMEELKAKAISLQKEYATEKMQHKMGRLKNVRILSMLRDDVARVMSVMHLKATQE